MSTDSLLTLQRRVPTSIWLVGEFLQNKKETREFCHCDYSHKLKLVRLRKTNHKNKFSRRYKDFHENSLISPKASCPCDVSLRFVLGVMHMERLVTQFVKCANAACVFLVTHGMNRPLLKVKEWELECGSPLRLSFPL